MTDAMHAILPRRTRLRCPCRRLAVALLAGAATWTASPAWAYRPFDGTDAAIAKPGEFELELGPLHYLREGSADFLIVPATVLNLGLTKTVELVSDFKNFLSVDSSADGSDTGLRRLRPRDADLLIKTVLRPGSLQGAAGPSIALETGALLPTPRTNSGFGAQANTILSFTMAGTALHFNESVAGNRDHRFEVFSSAIIELGYARSFRPVAEVFVDYILRGGSEYSALVGAIWAHSQDWVFDAAVRAARSDGNDVIELRLGFTWSAHLWHGSTEEVEL